MSWLCLHQPGLEQPAFAESRSYPGAGLIQGVSQAQEHVCKTACIEEIPQLPGEDPELVHKVFAEAAMGNALQHCLCSNQILGTRIPMQFVLHQCTECSEKPANAVALCSATISMAPMVGQLRW